MSPSLLGMAHPFARVAALVLVFGLSACAGGLRGSPSRPGPLEEGRQALKEGRPAEAIEPLRKALANTPSDPTAMRALVEAHVRSGRAEALERELAGAVAARPDDAQAHYGLGLLAFSRTPPDDARAVEQLGRAAGLRPQVADYHFRLGLVHLEAERFEPAATALRRARDLEPNSARHQVALGSALVRLGQRAEAIAAVATLLELAPEPKDLEAARRVVGRASDSFRSFPKSFEAEFQKGLDYMQADAPQHAAVAFQEILEKDPDIAVVHAALGLCFQRLDDSSRALEEFRVALELAPEDPRNHLHVAELYFSKERFEKAAEAYRATLQRDPFSEPAHERLGQLAQQRGDAAEASRHLGALVLLRPEDLNARLALGAALAARGERDGAERQFEHVLAKDPKSADALLRLAALDLERKADEKDPARARKYGERAAERLERLLDQQPGNAYAARLLQQARGTGAPAKNEGPR